MLLNVATYVLDTAKIIFRNKILLNLRVCK